MEDNKFLMEEVLAVTGCKTDRRTPVAATEPTRSDVMLTGIGAADQRDLSKYLLSRSSVWLWPWGATIAEHRWRSQGREGRPVQNVSIAAAKRPIQAHEKQCCDRCVVAIGDSETLKGLRTGDDKIAGSGTAADVTAPLVQRILQ
ncbi:MAG: hypothetical protein R8G34_13320 [Paracoccaceae bacterium]|nr:hypothetical protein [Paracoccaceae bacterium]